MKSFLDYACKKYYDGSPVMSDASFDRLAEQFSYEYVGSAPESNAIEHPYQMYSLQKKYVGEDTVVGVLPEPVLITPKLDGAAVALVYIDGALSRALTRGDGRKGSDITDNMRLIVPNEIDSTGLVQITGEVVASKDIENSRNYASGALGLKDPEEFATRDLTFIAYGLFPQWATGTWSADMVYVKTRGFNTVLDSDWSQFPQDGQVFRCDSHEDFQNLGFTSRHPRGAFALKTKQEGVVTTLLDVIWQVGKSGVVSPVAILEPININGATVGRATLHNPKYIKDLGLELGCQVEVIRAGEIIPRVVRRV